MVEQLVEMCVRAELSPDGDFRNAWKGLIWGTGEHYTTGHPQGSA